MIFLPDFPKSKISVGRTTPEFDILEKIRLGAQVSAEEIEVLDEAFGFYKVAFEALDAINLSEITEKDENDLLAFLENLFRFRLIMQNKVTPGLMFRMIWVADYNLEDGKVLDPKFLSYTPLDIVKINGCYGRANSPKSTCLYVTEFPQVAIYECKPKPGDRIIITGWEMNDAEPLVMYPINSADQINKGVDEATAALHKKLGESHKYYARMITAIQKFIGYHFTKDIPIISPKKHEYLYSAFFSDDVMASALTFEDEDNKPVFGQYDGIIYPSIATQYKYDNLAIRESSVHRLKPSFCHEYQIDQLDYENFDWSKDHLPFSGKLIRQSEEIGVRIKWNDD